MGKKINDTGEFPNTTPAADDFVLGVDVSNTSNDANGEVVTFTVESLRNATAYATAEQGEKADTALQPGANVSELTNDAGYTAATGTVDTSGTPEANDFARFTDANTLEGRSYSEVRSDLGLVIGTNVQAYSSNLTTFLGANALPSGNGTDGQVLTSDGAGAAAWEDAGGGGGLIPISKTTASADATVDIALTGGYSKYRIVMEKISGTFNQSLRAQLSVDGGLTFEATNYDIRISDGNVSFGSGANTYIYLMYANGVNSTARPTNGWMNITLGDGTAYNFTEHSIVYTSTGSVTLITIGGCILESSTTAATHIRFYMSSCNTTGTFHLYGLADGA